MLGLLGAPLPDARVSTPLDWNEVPQMRSSGFHGDYGSQAISRNWVIRTHKWTRQPVRWKNCWNWQIKTKQRAWETRLGPRTSAKRNGKRNALHLAL